MEKTLKQRFFDGIKNRKNYITLRDGRVFIINDVYTDIFRDDLTYGIGDGRKPDFDIMIVRDCDSKILFNRDSPVNELIVELI